MEANKLTRNNKDFKKFESQVEALYTFIKLTTVCLTFNNPRVEGEKDKIYSILAALDIVFPEFFEELTTFNRLKIHDRQEAILKKLKETQSDIQNAINLLEETINLEKVEQTPTDYVWWKSFLDDLVTGIA
jgi:hypothetical protein